MNVSQYRIWLHAEKAHRWQVHKKICEFVDRLRELKTKYGLENTKILASEYISSFKMYPSYVEVTFVNNYARYEPEVITLTYHTKNIFNQDAYFARAERKTQRNLENRSKRRLRQRQEKIEAEKEQLRLLKEKYETAE